MDFGEVVFSVESAIAGVQLSAESPYNALQHQDNALLQHSAILHHTAKLTELHYGVATISRLLRMICLFYRIYSLLIGLFDEFCI